MRGRIRRGERDRKSRQGHRIIRRVIGILVGIPLTLLIAFCLLVAYLTVTEYKPDARETIAVNGTENQAGEKTDKSAENQKGTKEELKAGDLLSVLSWNVGYGALGDNADFFMDGGKGVKTASQDRVKENLNEIVTEVKKINPDFALFQEVDVNSHRSYGIDESQILGQAIPRGQMTFA